MIKFTQCFVSDDGKAVDESITRVEVAIDVEEKKSIDIIVEQKGLHFTNSVLHFSLLYFHAFPTPFPLPAFF